MTESKYQYDVLVVGAGHAGTEAALAAARMGARCCLLTTNVDTVAQMSCNPAIGGVAKGQIVREIDALGGVMGRAIDETGIQFRLLNRRKGPAMHSPRAQADKKAYQQFVKLHVEEQENLDLRQEIVTDLLVETESGKQRILGVAVAGGARYCAPPYCSPRELFCERKCIRVKQNLRVAGQGRAPAAGSAEHSPISVSEPVDSRLELRRGLTDARLTMPLQKFNRAIRIHSPFLFLPGH